MAVSSNSALYNGMGAISGTALVMVLQSEFGPPFQSGEPLIVN